MDKLSQLVFNQHKIITYNTLTTELGKSIDEASNTLYQFYTANKSKLATYFLVTLEGSTEASIAIERLSGKELLEKLSNTEYQNNIKQIKLWAVCDKNKDEFGIEAIYKAEKNISHESQHGIHEISQKLRTLKIEDTPPPSQNERKIKPQLSKSTSFGEEKTEDKSDPRDKNLTKKGSFEIAKSNEKKESKPIERKNTAEFGKKSSFTEEKPASTALREELMKSTENKKKKAVADPTEDSEQVFKKSKVIKEKEENPSVRPKLEGNLNSFFNKKSDKKVQEAMKEETDEYPIADTNEEKLEDYFKHKKPSNENIEEPPINVSVKTKPSKMETEDESYYDGYIEEPVRERSPGSDNVENKPKRVHKKENNQMPAAYVEPKNLETKTENGRLYVRKNKTVMVEKSYMDEKGYLVSEQVSTVEEVWEEVKRGPSQSQVSALPQSDKKQTDKNQKSLTCFFKKM